VPGRTGTANPFYVTLPSWRLFVDRNALDALLAMRHETVPVLGRLMSRHLGLVGTLRQTDTHLGLVGLLVRRRVVRVVIPIGEGDH